MHHLLPLKHSLPAIHEKHKQQECPGSLTKLYWSAGRALTKRGRSTHRRRNTAQLHGTGETKPELETSVVSETERPDVAAKARLGERRDTETKTKERKLKGELWGELCSLESGLWSLATTMYNFIYLF